MLGGPIKGKLAMHNLSRRSAFHLVLLVTAFPLVTSASAGPDTPLAIQGYDPVAYFTDGKPTRGLPEYRISSGTSSATALRARSIASFSRLIPSATRRNSEISARWRWPGAKSSRRTRNTG